jgi:predicted CXXCH cytochrome family protein
MHSLRLEGVDLGEDVPDDPETAKLVAEAKARVTTASGGDATRFVARLVLDEASPYAGGQACVGCHRDEHAQWSTTPHSRAWQALVKKERALDEQCWGCHVTGEGQEGGPPNAADSGPWRDVQCEACHGPGRAHVAKPEEAHLVKTPAVEACTGCHDGVQDQGRFDPVEYMPKVAHGATAE